MTQKEIKEILERHQHWIKEDCDGWENMCADLRLANLRGADLRGADLRGAYLSNVKNMPHIPMACPTHGTFIGFKKAIHECRSCIVKLLIPEDARRSSATGYKCRCDKAKVLDIESISGQAHYDTAVSSRNKDFKYIVGETVQVSDFDTNRFNECAPGIHFFVDKQAAIDYEI